MAKTQQKRPARKSGKGKKFKKRERKNVPFGLVFIQASFNNTIVTITDQQGNTLSWKSSGSLGFRGSRKGTPFAAQQAAVNAAKAARDHGVRSVDVRVSGPGSGREIGDPCAGCSGHRCALASATLRRCRTMAAVRRSAAACKSGSGFQPQLPEPWKPSRCISTFWIGMKRSQRVNRSSPEVMESE